jgi:molecular chaperone GrpE
VSQKNKESATTSNSAELFKKLNEGMADAGVEVAGDEIPEPELITQESYAEVQKKLNEAEQKANQYWERLLRMQAEADNLQRRMERDVANAHKYALEKFVLELLPVVDNMERSLQVSKEAQADNALLEGIQLTLKSFYAALEKFGVIQVNPEGEAFNPELHQAVSVQIDPNAKPNTVLGVLQKGYLLNNRLIRPAFVIVSKAS